MRKQKPLIHILFYQGLLSLFITVDVSGLLGGAVFMSEISDQQPRAVSS